MKNKKFIYQSVFESENPARARVARRWHVLAFLLRMASFSGFVWLANLFFAIGSRKMNEEEIQITKSIYGKSVDYQKIRINQQSFFAKKFEVAFVTFNVIHCNKNMPPDLLAHELMHVWQFQNVGAAYVAFALAAQRTHEGYDYGGATPLQKAQSIFDFNCEQQAQIVQDYFLLSTKNNPQYLPSNQDLLPLFDPFLKEIRVIRG